MIASDKETMGTRLIGLKEICAHVQRGEKTVLRHIREDGLPAKKVNQRWISDKLLINDWWRKLVADPDPRNSESIPKMAPPKNASSAIETP